RNRNAKNRGVQENIVAAGKFGMETGSDFDQGHQPAGDGDFAAVGRSDAGEQLDQGGFAGAIRTDNTQNLATPNVEADVLQCPEAFCRPKPEQAVVASVMDAIGL